MRNWVIFFMGMSGLFVSCGQTGSSSVHNPAKDRLTCLVVGYDSIIYYTGDSHQMEDVKKGKIYDTAFVNRMFRTIKDRGFLLTIKPGDGGNMMPDFQKMINLANDHDITNRSVDAIDGNEEKAFGFSTPPQIKTAMMGQGTEPLKLDLPKDESTGPNAISNFPKASQLVILFSSSIDIYAYMGGDIQKGKKYTYQELTDFLKMKKLDKNFSVAIKPAGSSTYKSIVDMLDIMKSMDIKNYALIDITKDEEEYLRGLTNRSVL